MLQIAYTSPDPEMSAAVVNTITDIFIQEDLKSNQAAAIKAQEFISAQLPQSDIAVQEAESALRDFKELNGVVNLETESQNTVEVLTNFQSLSTELSSNLAGVQARIDEIQGQLDLSPDQAFAVSQVSEASGVQELLTQLQEVQSQLSLARTRYEEVHPEIANLSSQEAALFSLLDQRVGAALGGDRSSLPVNDLQIGDVEKDLIASYLSLITEESALAEQLGEVSLAREAQQARAQVLPGLEQQQRENPPAQGVGLGRCIQAARELEQVLDLGGGQTRQIEKPLHPRQRIGRRCRGFLRSSFAKECDHRGLRGCCPVSQLTKNRRRRR